MKRLIISGLTLFLLTGCGYKYKYSKAPYPVKYSSTEQNELQSAYHWKLIAEDFAKNLSNLKGKIYLIPTTDNKSVFTKNFINLLKSELIKRKKLVLNDTPEAIKIKVNINVVKFNSNRDVRTLPYKLSMLATGLWVASAIKSPAIGAAFATGAIATGEYTQDHKYNKFYSNVPNHEIIITAYAYKGNSYISSVDKIYYIADKDAKLYKNDDTPIITLRGENE